MDDVGLNREKMEAAIIPISPSQTTDFSALRRAPRFIVARSGACGVRRIAVLRLRRNGLINPCATPSLNPSESE